MPRFYPNTHINDCWGSAGSKTFYHRGGKCFWKDRPNPTFPASVSQIRQLDVHRRALAAWRQQPETVKEQWRECACRVEPHRPPFDHSSHITGCNLFVSAYHGFAILGNERVPEARPFKLFPPFSVEFVSASVEASFLKVRLRLSLFCSDEPQRYRLLAKVQVVRSGWGSNPGKMRNCLASESDSDNNVVLSVSMPSELAGLSSMQLHTRCVLIDTQTGYRSHYRKMSFLLYLSK